MRKLVAGGLGFRFCRERSSLHHRMSLAARFGVLMLLALVSGSANAQTLTTLLSFNGANGSNPEFGSLTLSGSVLYGTTTGGGTYNRYGTVFSVPVSGGTGTVLHSFNGSDGLNPFCALTLSGSTLYGTTTDEGESGGNGTIFSIPLGGGALTTLFRFNGSNGTSPGGSLTLIGSTVYGTTEAGGLNGGGGTVFSFNTAGAGFNSLCSLNGRYACPNGGMVLGGSTLYGTTWSSGTYGDGTIFSVPVSGGTATTLFSFSGANGQRPQDGLTLGGSTLYGTTGEGGAYNHGTVFSMPVSGGTPTTLLSFSGTNGAMPWGILVLSGSTLYGTTSAGGAYSDGTIFSMSVSGGTATTLFSFNGSDGQGPTAGLTLSGSVLYGTTTSGGAVNAGTVFALNIAPATIALSSISSATIISGGTGTVGMTLSNSPTSGYNLNYTLSAAVTSGTASLGTATPTSGSLAPGGSQSCMVSATSTHWASIRFRLPPATRIPPTFRRRPRPP